MKEGFLNHLMGMPPNASEHGALIDHMLEFCHWFMLLLFVGWSAFFLFTLFRFHKSRHPKADFHGVKTKASTHIEFVVVLIEAVLLLGFAIPLWAMRVNDFPKKDPLVVRVVGQQYFWNMWYPGADGIFGKQKVNLISSSNQLGLDLQDSDTQDDIVTNGELHLPVGRPVILEITSKDVIHSLSLQSMRIGQDAIPGISIPIWFTPTVESPEESPYEIICGQLCGFGHSSMRGSMTVESPGKFEAWLKSQAPAPAAVPAATPTPASPLSTPAPSPAPNAAPPPGTNANATANSTPKPGQSPPPGLRPPESGSSSSMATPSAETR